jgi:sensor histidine kinase YesM
MEAPQVTTAEAQSTQKPRRYWVELSDLNWRLLFGLYTVAGLISAGSVFTASLAEGSHQPYYYPLLWEMTGYYTGFLVLPAMVLALSRLPISKDNWRRTVPLHLGLSLCFGIVHTLLMYSTRHVIYSFLGWGPYQYGHLGYALLMEYHKQLLHYSLVYAVLRGVSYYRVSREQEQAAAAFKLRASELQRQLGLAQLQALRSQLNPHFLFNTLNMISSVMYEDPDRADHMIAALSRMLRLSLDEHVAPEVPLRRELEFLEAAGDLLKARFGDRLDLQVHCEPGLADAPLPSLVLHTLVENAIKHHENPDDPLIRVQVRVTARDGRLDLQVDDNGPGMAHPEKAVGSGVGLANTQERLRALYGSDHEFSLGNRPEGGLQVRISIPLRKRPVLQPA